MLLEKLAGCLSLDSADRVSLYSVAANWCSPLRWERGIYPDSTWAGQPRSLDPSFVSFVSFCS
jgi:hypothetical protein